MIKIAAILDNFSRNCFDRECDLDFLTPKNWRFKLMFNRYDFLLVESAWIGRVREWHNKVRIREGKRKKNVIVNLVNAFNEKGIPTVFWNKEDPVHFNVFINTAKLFNSVFTTDANCIEKYREHGINAIAMPFAASDKLHYFDDCKRDKKIFFSGSYYKHFEERCKVTDWMLSSALDYGLDIFDRNYNNSILKKITSAEEFQRYVFPDKFQPYIRGTIPPEKMGEIYRKYKIMLNINTVTNSPTMCARRVFEAINAGCVVISNPSPVNKEIFNGCVIEVNNGEEVKNAVELLLNDEDYRNKIVQKGRKIVSANHTYSHRINTFYNAAKGINEHNEHLNNSDEILKEPIYKKFINKNKEVSILDFKLKELDQVGPGLIFKFRLENWDKISYLAYGFIDKKSKYWHISIKFPEQNKLINEKFVPNSIAFKLTNNFEELKCDKVKSLRIFVKGVCSEKGSTIELIKVNKIAQELKENNFLITNSNGAQLYFSNIQGWYSKNFFERIDKRISESLTKYLWREVRGKSHGMADLYFKSGLVCFPIISRSEPWPVRQLAPPSSIKKTLTYRFIWHSLAFVSELILQYEQSSNVSYLFAARDFVVHWLSHNFYIKTDDVKYAWYDHGTPLRLLALLKMWEVGINLAFDCRFMSQLLDAIYQHADLLASNFFFSRDQRMKYHNHALYQATALLFAGEYMHNLLDASVWRNKAIEMLKELKYGLVEFEEGYGISKENSLGYHDGVREIFSSIDEVLRLLKISDMCSSISKNMSLFSETINYLDGTKASYGDSYRGDRRNNVAHRENKKDIRSNDPSFIVFSKSGYAILRDRTTEGVDYQLNLIASSQTIIHKHQDNLSFTLWADGIEWLIDPGFISHEYEETINCYLRGASGHNSLVLTHREYSIEPGVASISGTNNKKDNKFELKGHHSSYKKVMVKRNIDGMFGIGDIHFTDSVEGATELEAELLFHCGEGVNVSIDNNVLVLSHKATKVNILITLPKNSNAKLYNGYCEGEKVYGWVGQGFNKYEPINSIVCRASLASEINWNINIKKGK